jgi:hypothetical protein
MGLSIRPVLETWGEPCSFLSHLVAPAELRDAISGLRDLPAGSSHVKDYGDLTVFWTQEGEAFLKYLETTPPAAIVKALESSGFLEFDPFGREVEEWERNIADVTTFCRMAPAWRKSLKPADGRLRIYCD